MKLLIATTNAGKVREINDILSGVTASDRSPIDIVPLSMFPDLAEPEENGETFAENARLKALYYARATRLPSVADDSGLVIDALDGAPGVHSARWHGTDYGVKFQKIYEMLDARGLATSTARFVCHIVLADASGVLYESEASVNGEITREPRGTNGFGYDPIFFYPPYGCTLAELDLERKAGVSHRGKAFRSLRTYLESAGASLHLSEPG
jgi:XTP/dITP diphosphohydrolase